MNQLTSPQIRFRAVRPPQDYLPGEWNLVDQANGDRVVAIVRQYAEASAGQSSVSSRRRFAWVLADSPDPDVSVCGTADTDTAALERAHAAYMSRLRDEDRVRP
jgi:hypothetical protein